MKNLTFTQVQDENIFHCKMMGVARPAGRLFDAPLLQRLPMHEQDATAIISARRSADTAELQLPAP